MAITSRLLSYRYSCIGHDLDLGLTLGQADPLPSKSQALHLPYNAGSGTVHLAGFGPVVSANFNPSLLTQAFVSPNCIFSVTAISAAEIVTVGTVNADLTHIRSQVAPWSKVYAKTVVLHGAYIGNQTLALCSLKQLVSGLEKVFGARTIQDIERAGGVSAQELLTEAVKAANDAGVISIGDQDPFTYLVANYDNAQTGIKDLASARCTETSMNLLTPNLAACNGNVACKVNVDDFNEAVANLKSLRDKAAADYRQIAKISAEVKQADWYLALSSLKLN